MSLTNDWLRDYGTNLTVPKTAITLRKHVRFQNEYGQKIRISVPIITAVNLVKIFLADFWTYTLLLAGVIGLFHQKMTNIPSKDINFSFIF